MKLEADDIILNEQNSSLLNALEKFVEECVDRRIKEKLSTLEEYLNPPPFIPTEVISEEEYKTISSPNYRSKNPEINKIHDDLVDFFSKN
ncbi:MAG: hypothetical protein FWE37_00415 [Spirochaetaceae bacterium]|nr:hypothetical protein [Spirochaetaceae bacterium]